MKTQKSKPKTSPRTKTGLTADILDLEGKIVGEVELPKEIFAVPVNNRLLAQAIRVYLANQCQGTVSTKTRGEVAGSTAKIWRQKGTGRARHGSRKAPIFVGGGIVFGPKPRDFSLKLPQKMKNKALFSALASKFKDKEILIINSFQNFRAKTKEMVRVLKNLNLNLSSPMLLITAGKEKNLLLACRNIQNLTLTPVNLLNPYIILANKKIVFTKESIEALSNLWKTVKS